jgi:hypothetical protein
MCRSIQSFAMAGVLLAGITGCEAPKRILTYPAGTLPVHYEPATAHSTCLVASVAMAANYLVGERRLTEAAIRQDLKAAGKDETSVEDLKAYLETKWFYLLTLSGRLDAKPPIDLGYWVQVRGYPVICVLNGESDDPAFNHAVVVTGIVKGSRAETAGKASERQTPDKRSEGQRADAASGAQTADTIYYLDPSTPRPLRSLAPAEFEAAWTRSGHAMMIVVAPPPDTEPAGR